MHKTVGIFLTTFFLIAFFVYAYQAGIRQPSTSNLIIGNQNQSSQIKNGSVSGSSVSQNLSQLKDRTLKEFTLDGQVFLFELVISEEARAQGLSGRREIGSDGMLFVFPEVGYHGIWMKQMKFDLDLIWLDETGQVTDLTFSLPAPVSENLDDLLVYRPSRPAAMVLEAPAGFIEKHQVQSGQKLTILD